MMMNKMTEMIIKLRYNDDDDEVIEGGLLCMGLS